MQSKMKPVFVNFSKYNRSQTCRLSVLNVLYSLYLPCTVFYIQNKSEFVIYLLFKLQNRQKSSLHYHQDRERGWKVTHQAFDGKGIVDHCECGRRKAMFCASNILLTAARSDLGITCKYISHSGPPLYTERQTHTHLNPPPWVLYPPPASSTEVNYQNCVWKWMKGDLLPPPPFSLSLSLPLSSLTSQFFSLLATVSGLGDNCR